MPDKHETAELQRRRWRRARHQVGLENSLAEEFGVGGVARHVPDVRFRLVVLPGDPERHLVEFDQELKKWLVQPRPSPFGEGMMQIGTDYRVTVDAAVRYSDRTADNRWRFQQYVALLRCGGLEFGSGMPAVYSVRPDITVFRLIYMVGRLWLTLHLYQEVIQRFTVNGPWEVSIALRNTMGSYLGHFASGWQQEPTDAWARSERPPCAEGHVLIRREIAAWPRDSEELQRLVFSLADHIENCWGWNERLYLSREGPESGRFDVSKYR